MNKHLTAAFAFAALAALAAPAKAEGNADLVARGAYVALAGDCVACHTAPGGEKFGGGYAISTPFGTIMGSNISSDKTYGIGDWTDDQFVAAVREGVGAHGENLYPAMPYDSFNKMTRDDVLAVKAYLLSQPPVHQPTPANKLSFPFNQRWTLTFWKWMNVSGGEMKPDPAHDAQWNRGHYLVDALEHCGACHTPRNLTLGMSSSRYLGGGDLGAWTAFNITSDKVAGIGGWTDQQVTDYLHDGLAAGRGVAAGPMGEAVEHSLQYLKPEDIAAMVAYLRTVPAISGPDTAVRSGQGQPSTDYAMLRGADPATLAVHQGAVLYLQNCATCHAANGMGEGKGAQSYPSLVHDGSVGAAATNNLVSTILSGVKRTMAGGEVMMPSFARTLTDDQVAALATYIKRQFGGQAVTITAKDVKPLRTVGQTPYPDLTQASN